LVRENNGISLLLISHNLTRCAFVIEITINFAGARACRLRIAYRRNKPQTDRTRTEHGSKNRFTHSFLHTSNQEIVRKRTMTLALTWGLSRTAGAAPSRIYVMRAGAVHERIAPQRPMSGRERLSIKEHDAAHRPFPRSPAGLRAAPLAQAHHHRGQWAQPGRGPGRGRRHGLRGHRPRKKSAALRPFQPRQPGARAGQYLARCLRAGAGRGRPPSLRGREHRPPRAPDHFRAARRAHGCEGLGPQRPRHRRVAARRRQDHRLHRQRRAQPALPRASGRASASAPSTGWRAARATRSGCWRATAPT